MSPNASTACAMKDPKITDEDLGDPKPTKKEITTWNILLISCVSPGTRILKKCGTCPVPLGLDCQKLYCVC
jgi:hypothetical protein